MSRRVAVLVSGGGRSLENLAERCAGGPLDAELGLVISNKTDAYALERAERLGIPSQVIDAGREMSPEAFSEAVFQATEDAGCSLVVLAGFLRFLTIPTAWEGRVLNIHPSLLPAFRGGNALAYIATHGFPEIDPGQQNWSLKSTYNDAGEVILELATEMNTDPLTGTSPVSAHAALEQRLNQKFTVNHTWNQSAAPATMDMMIQDAINDGIILPYYYYMSIHHCTA